MKLFKVKYLLVVLSLLFIACSPGKDDYTKNWSGSWRTTKDLRFPNVKTSNYGTIKKVEGERNKLQISGDLFGISQLYNIEVSLSSEKVGSLTYNGNFSISGNAYFNQQDTIRFYLTVTQDNKSLKDTITAVKITENDG